MRRRVTGRALVATLAALTILSLSAAAALADTVPADGDAITAGDQSLVDLGAAAPGATLTRPVALTLTCAGLSHAPAGSTITLALDSVSVPLDGTASATTTTIGPVPADWTAAGEGCPSPAPTLPAAAPSTVTLTMPTTPGTDYEFTLAWSRTGTTGLTGMTAVTFRVDIVAAPSVAWSVVWGEPIAPAGSRAAEGASPGTGAAFVAQAGRTIPVKLEIFADGVEQTTGDALLDVLSCAGTGPTVEVALGWDAGRWAAHLDTSRLAGPGCYVASATLDGTTVGSFDLHLKGSSEGAAARRR